MLLHILLLNILVIYLGLVFTVPQNFTDLFLEPTTPSSSNSSAPLTNDTESNIVTSSGNDPGFIALIAVIVPTALLLIVAYFVSWCRLSRKRMNRQGEDVGTEKKSDPFAKPKRVSSNRRRRKQMESLERFKKFVVEDQKKPSLNATIVAPSPCLDEMYDLTEEPEQVADLEEGTWINCSTDHTPVQPSVNFETDSYFFPLGIQSNPRAHSLPSTSAADPSASKNNSITATGAASLGSTPPLEINVQQEEVGSSQFHELGTGGTVVATNTFEVVFPSTSWTPAVMSPPPRSNSTSGERVIGGTSDSGSEIIPAISRSSSISIKKKKTSSWGKKRISPNFIAINNGDPSSSALATPIPEPLPSSPLSHEENNSIPLQTVNEDTPSTAAATFQAENDPT